MPRYGGGQEDFREQERRLAAMQERLASIEAKEAQATGALEDLGVAEQRATARRATLNKAKQEGADITARESAVAKQEAAAVDIDTAAIERNRIARERRAAAARQEAVNVNRALAGARDPLFAQATASGITSQYGLRQQLGVGQQRAARLQEAIRASFLAPGNATGQVGAQTRVQAAERGVVEADIALTAAKREYTAATRRGAQAEAEAAYAERERATGAQQAARLELESAQQAAAAASELAAARRTAAEAAAIAAAREAQAAVVRGGAPGGALIVHPTAATGGRVGLESADAGLRINQAALGTTRALAAANAVATKAAQDHAIALQLEAKGVALATDAELAYVTSLNAEARAQIAAAAAAGNAAREQIAARAIANAGALRQEGVAMTTVSQAMHRHGALTSEFIVAAARGEVTLREMGNQALITAGKFGGWTIAATGLFGVARALGQIAHGAVQAQSGVTGLERFIPHVNRDEAIQGFQQVSREVNVPIEDVAQTQGLFARVFHNQRDSLIATSTALKAYQLDQVNAADAARYFTAIIQEGRIPAERLPSLFDQISRAQRVMSARVSETLPALARSFGAVKNAGGDLNELLALVTTTQVATGQTGSSVGTAFYRGAATFFPKNRNELRDKFGIEDTSSFTRALIEAVRKAQDLNGDQRRELAKAFFGPQLGGRFAALFNRAPELNRALGETSPGASRGSADEELHKRLQQVDQQVTKLGINLQALGAALSQSGALSFAGAFLKILNLTLGTVTSMVDLFNHLPGPLRQTLAIAAELALVIKGMQRFGLTERFANGPLGFLANPDRQLATRTRGGLRGARDEAFNEQERTQTRAYRARAAAQRAQEEAQRVAKESAALSVGTDAQSAEAYAQGQARVAAANAQAARLADQAAVAASEAADARLHAALADEEYAAAAKMDNATLVRTAREQNIPVPVLRGAPNTAGTTEGGLPPIVDPVRRTTETELRRAQRVAGTGLSENARRIEQEMGAYWAYYGMGVRDLGASGRAIDRGAQATIKAAARGVSTAEGAFARMRAAGSGLASFAASLGPLDYALIGFAAYEILKPQLDKLDASTRARTRALSTDEPNTRAQVRRLQDQARAARADHGSRLHDALVEVEHPFELGGVAQRQRDYENQLAAQRQQEQALRTQLQAQHRRAGTPLPQLTYDQLIPNIEHDADLRRRGLISQLEFDRRMANHAVEAKILLDPTKQQLAQTLAAINAANAAQGSVQSFAQSLRHVSDKTLDSTQQAVGAQYQRDPTANLSRLRTVYNEYVKRYSRRAGLGDPGAIGALEGARQAYYQALTDNSQTELNYINSQTGDQSLQAARAVRVAQTNVTRAGQIFGTKSQQYRQALTALNEARRNQAQVVLQNVEADNALLVARAGSDPIAQANAAVQSAQNTLSALQAQGKRADPNAVKNQLAQLITARTQRSDAIRQQESQVSDLYGQLAQARAQSSGDPVAAARAGQAAARRALGMAHTRVERLQALVNLTQANGQLQDAIRQQEDARYTYLESLTTDPLRQAHLETQRARHDIRGTRGAGRLTARAEYNRQLQSERDARLQAREDDIEFERTMGHLTVQGAIDRYNTLLSVRNLTKAQRRDIMLKIHQLQQDSESEASGFNLDLGGIKMPTLFDVRKAFTPIHRHVKEAQHAALRETNAQFADITSNVSHMYDARSQVAANIQVIVNDKNAAGEVYTAIDRALGTSVRARMRSRGMR